MSVDRPNQLELLNRVGRDISAILTDESRKRRTGARMNRVLLRGIHDEIDLSDESESLSDDERKRYRLVEPYLALAQMPPVVRQCEFYFRRYPFRPQDVSRSDHLRNICEMYFDRVVQFRDRLKKVLTVCREDKLVEANDVSTALKSFDKVFEFEHRFRNQTHHSARFDYIELNRIGLIELLGNSLPDALSSVLSPRALYRKESEAWVARVRSRSERLEEVVESVAGILLNSPHLQ